LRYDDEPNATRDLDAVVVRRAPLRLRGRDVLEIGCGTGKNTQWLAEHARSVLALDFSEGMLAAARRRIAAPNVAFVRHDARDPWPLGDAAVEVVIGNLVLEHVADLAPIYAEAARVLRPGGQLFLCELHPERQRRGAQAHFIDGETGAAVRVPACFHSAGDYLSAGHAAGLTLVELGEWRDPGATDDVPPRLLSVLFARA
jgi:malonyl-CoA O-methyltransferase